MNHPSAIVFNELPCYDHVITLMVQYSGHKRNSSANIYRLFVFKLKNDKLKVTQMWSLKGSRLLNLRISEVFLDISAFSPYNLIRIFDCHRVVSESACLHIVRS